MPALRLVIEHWLLEYGGWAGSAALSTTASQVTGPNANSYRCIIRTNSLKFRIGDLDCLAQICMVMQSFSCRWLVINTAVADTITAFMRSSLRHMAAMHGHCNTARQHSRRAASFSFSHQNASISPSFLDQQLTPWACHAEDVLGAFFGRHRQLSTAMQPAFGGQSKQHQGSAPDIDLKCQTALRPSDSASSLLAACASNIVPLPYQRMHVNQFSASPADFATLAGCQPGSQIRQLLLQQADEPRASQLMQLKHPLSPSQSSQQPKGCTQRGVLSELYAIAHSQSARRIDSADQISVHCHGEPILLQPSMLRTFYLIFALHCSVQYLFA